MRRYDYHEIDVDVCCGARVTACVCIGWGCRCRLQPIVVYRCRLVASTKKIIYNSHEVICIHCIPQQDKREADRQWLYFKESWIMWHVQPWLANVQPYTREFLHYSCEAYVNSRTISRWRCPLGRYSKYKIFLRHHDTLYGNGELKYTQLSRRLNNLQKLPTGRNPQLFRQFETMWWNLHTAIRVQKPPTKMIFFSVFNYD